MDIVHLSPRLRSFLNRHIASVEHVEVLLLLKSSPERLWIPEEIASELRRSAKSARQRLRDLVRSKLVRRDTDARFAYQPSDEDDVVEELAREFESRRVRLIEAIFTQRVDTAQSFADAFRIVGEQDDG